MDRVREGLRTSINQQGQRVERSLPGGQQVAASDQKPCLSLRFQDLRLSIARMDPPGRLLEGLGPQRKACAPPPRLQPFSELLKVQKLAQSPRFLAWSVDIPKSRLDPRLTLSDPPGPGPTSDLI